MQHDEQSEKCSCAICVINRALKVPENPINVMGIQGINIKDLLEQLVMDAPDDIRLLLVSDLIGTICVAAVRHQVPEDERSDPSAWEGNSPVEILESAAEALREALPNAEQMAELWDRYLALKAAEAELADSENPLTVPEEWAKGEE